MNLPLFEANINVKGTFKVGPIQRPGNAVELEIKRKAAQVENGRTDLEILELVFTGALGTGEDALWLNIADVKKCRIEITGKWGEDIEDIWHAEWKFIGGETDKKTFKLTIFTDEDPYFEYLQSVLIRISNIISKTAPGDAVLTFGTNYSDDCQKLLISKLADKPGIIFFESDPSENVPNFPGDTVTLTWHTHELNNRELIQVGSAYPRQCNFEGNEGEHKIAASDSNVTYRLQGDHGRRNIFRDIEIKSLRPGWHDVGFTVFKGEPGFPVPKNEEERKRLEDVQSIDLEPAVLFNADDEYLYGIFRNEFEGRENAYLFQTKNLLAGWNIVPTSVRGRNGNFQRGNIPEGFSASPGVFFKGKLYLIGGSQIDKTHFSSSVWYIDPNETQGWVELKILNHEPRDIPEPRMGHGVLVFKEKIWVMGGLTRAGNALNDVWSLDITKGQGKWHRLGKARWRPRCLISPVEYDDAIWLYGGAERPFSAELFDDLYSCDYIDEEKVEWKEQKMMGVIKGSDKKKPIASCMQVFDNKLHLFGNFRSTDDDDGSRLDDPLGFCLTDRPARTWERFPSDGLKAWGENRTFSYQAVNFRNKMLIAKALGDQIGESTVLKVYVSG